MAQILTICMRQKDKFGLRKATESEFSGLTFWLRFGSGFYKPKPKFGFRTSLINLSFSTIKKSISKS